jgi:hypothetical protein
VAEFLRDNSPLGKTFLGSMNLALKLYDLLVQNLSGKIIINYFSRRR